MTPFLRPSIRWQNGADAPALHHRQLFPAVRRAADLGLMACGCLVLLLSSLAKQTLTAFLTGFFALFLGILLHDGSGSRTGLKWFNPTELLFPGKCCAGTGS